MSTPQDPRYGPADQPSGEYPPPPAYQQGGYPGYPGGTSSPYGEPSLGQPARPPAVLIVSIVLWALTGLFLVLPGLTFVLAGGNFPEQQLDEMADMAEAYGVQVDPAVLEQSLVVGVIIGIVLGVLLIVLPLLMLGRQNWARILLTVVGVLSLLPVLGTVVGPLVIIVAIVLQFLPASNAFFRERRQHA